MNLIEINKELIRKISTLKSEGYVNLPEYYHKFDYPLSIDVVDYLGKLFYERGYADINGFLAILTTKIYTTIIQHKDASTISNFLFNEDPYIFRSKTSKLILAVKKLC